MKLPMCKKPPTCFNEWHKESVLAKGWPLTDQYVVQPDYTLNNIQGE